MGVEKDMGRYRGKYMEVRGVFLACSVLRKTRGYTLEIRKVIP
jgi:hypothetical protein